MDTLAVVAISLSSALAHWFSTLSHSSRASSSEIPHMYATRSTELSRRRWRLLGVEHSDVVFAAVKAADSVAAAVLPPPTDLRSGHGSRPRRPPRWFDAANHRLCSHLCSLPPTPVRGRVSPDCWLDALIVVVVACVGRRGNGCKRQWQTTADDGRDSRG
jgi:hypothetical protein